MSTIYLRQMCRLASRLHKSTSSCMTLRPLIRVHPLLKRKKILQKGAIATTLRSLTRAMKKSSQNQGLPPMLRSHIKLKVHTTKRCKRFSTSTLLRAQVLTRLNSRLGALREARFNHSKGKLTTKATRIRFQQSGK